MKQIKIERNDSIPNLHLNYKEIEKDIQCVILEMKNNALLEIRRQSCDELELYKNRKIKEELTNEESEIENLKNGEQRNKKEKRQYRKSKTNIGNINKDYFEKYSIELIEKTNARFNELTEKMEKDNKEMHHKLKKDINIKELIHITRTSLRDNFIKVNKKVEEKIMKTVETDFRNNTDAIKEDSNEINIDDSEYNENSASNK